MNLPQNIQKLMARLESAGYEAWAVGGCVRDHLLGIAPHDFDLCTCAAPEQIQRVFEDHRLVLAGIKHGTVGVVTDGGVVEITTFRTEGDYADSRHPGWVRFVSDVEQDLARRDFTVNAIAYSPVRGYRDPFGGRQDLEKRLLRCVGQPEKRFQEDALRILRGARFAARFGMRIEEKTWNAMLSTAGLLEKLARERVFDELCKLICLVDAKELCKLAPVLVHVIPELGPMVGFDQRSPHHAHDVFTHTAWVVQRVPPQAELRLAALLHDVGKPGCFTVDATGRGHFYGHADRSGRMADEILLRLKAPAAVREETVWLIEHHMAFFPPTRKGIRRLLSRHGSGRLMKLNELHRADLLGKDAEDISRELAQLEYVRGLLEQVLAEEGRFSLGDLAVDGHDLMEMGIPAGPAIGTVLNRLLDAVLCEEVSNEKQPLLALANDIWTELGQEGQ